MVHGLGASVVGSGVGTRVKIGVVGTRVGVAEVGASVGRFDGVGVGFVVGDNDWSVGLSEGI